MKRGAESTVASNPAPLIKLTGISKRFGTHWANGDISLDIEEGEIHAIVGENGAGKSTLMKILYGIIQPDAGTIFLQERPVVFKHPREALQAGIGMVHQQLLIFPQLTALENIIVGSEPRTLGWIKRRRAAARIGDLCRLFGFELPLDRHACELSFAQRQQIELVRVLFKHARILILDEPTSLLAPPEVEQLLQFLKAFKQEGHTVVFISHRLDEVLALADRITILRRGRAIGTVAATKTQVGDVASAIMTGTLNGSSGSYLQEQCEPLRSGPMRPEGEDSSPSLQSCLELQRIFVRPASDEMGLNDFSLSVRRGEIFGIGGVVGNGQRTLARVVAGMETVEQGAIFLEGRDITGSHIRDRAKAGVRWLPANPSEEALMMDASIRDNLILGRQREPLCNTHGWLLERRIEPWVQERLATGEVAFSNMEEDLAALSGGNQQKIALARVLEGKPRLIVLEQPGRGLDIGARERLCRRLRELSTEGVALILLSHDLDELLSLSHRIGVMYRGKIMGIVGREQAVRQSLGRWMLGLANQERSCSSEEGYA
jgi:simple sugar transport system ATP-binding protein